MSVQHDVVVTTASIQKVRPKEFSFDVDPDRPRTSLATLMHEKDRLGEQKSIIRDKLQSYQDNFQLQNGRKIKYHKDILPIEREYRQYKMIKESLGRVEADLAELR